MRGRCNADNGRGRKDRKKKRVETKIENLHERQNRELSKSAGNENRDERKEQKG